MDKVKIMLTVDPKDLLSTKGLKQAGTVTILQAKLYYKDILSALKQAAEADVNKNQLKL